MKSLHLSLFWIGAVMVTCSGTAYAGKDVYRPQITTTQWRTMIRETPIQQLHVYVRKASGSDTYFNMRFGRKGHTFDGRRVYLKSGGTVKASWNLNGRSPGGQELILNAYNGSVHVERVEVVYQDARRRQSGPGYYDYRGGYDHRDPYYDNGYRHNGGYDPYYDNRYRRYDSGHGYPDHRYTGQGDYAGNPSGCNCGRHPGQAHAPPPPPHYPSHPYDRQRR